MLNKDLKNTAKPNSFPWVNQAPLNKGKLVPRSLAVGGSGRQREVSCQAWLDSSSFPVLLGRHDHRDWVCYAQEGSSPHLKEDLSFPGQKDWKQKVKDGEMGYQSITLPSSMEVVWITELMGSVILK